MPRKRIPVTPLTIEVSNHRGDVFFKYELSPKQERFLKSVKKYICYSGGFGCGKSLILILKIFDLMLSYKDNYGLIGRYNYSDLRDSTEKDFFDLCPEGWIKSRNKQEKRVTFYNNSTLIFRGLKDVRKEEVRSMNLGFFALEQAEEIGELIFDELGARLRRDVRDYDGNPGVRQGMATTNPALTWLFKKFVQTRVPGKFELIEGSTLDNEKHLPKDYIEDLMSHSENWIRQFVYGIWDESLLSEKAVFPIEFIKAQEGNLKKPIRFIEDIEIYENVKSGEEYQVGVDPSEGAKDFSVIKCINKNTGAEVASFRKRIAPDLLAFKVDLLGRTYNDARVVLEINGIGLATLTKLKDLAYPNIYQREEFDHQSKTMTKRLGWRTTVASKPLLIGHFQKVIRVDKGKVWAIIRDPIVVAEMKTFVYSDLVGRSGMGAEVGFHDDSIIAITLAYWQVEPGKPMDTNLIIGGAEEADKKEILHIEDFLTEERSPHWLEL